MQKIDFKEEKYLVLFMPHDFDGKGTFWEKLFCFCLNRLKKNYSHVVLYKQSRIEWNLIEINPASDNLIIREINKNDILNIMLKKEVSSLVVKARVAPIKAKGLITCVSIAKSILGIDKASIITPYQLFKYLEKTNGK